MKIPDVGTTGTDAYKRPTLPQLTVIGRLRPGLLADIRAEVAGDVASTANRGAGSAAD